MKRTVTLILALVICLSLCACGECEHTFTPATCTTPATCSKCGATQGEALGHTWVEATCTMAKTCETCGLTMGEPLPHEWVEATCTESKHCSACGLEEGDPLGHKWAEATCTEPATCTVCGETNGEPTGHVIEESVVTKESTCTEPGIETGVCTVCGETVETEMALLDHTPSDWIVTTPATKSTKGVREKQCTVCGVTLETEEFEKSEEEIEKEFKAACKAPNYKDLLRNPGEHKGDLVKVSGNVFQVCSEASSPFYYSTYFIRSNGNLYNVKIDNYGSSSRILKGDKITIWGTVDDLYSYETVRGDGNTIANIIAEYYTIDG